jgi:DNA modification methylase
MGTTEQLPRLDSHGKIYRKIRPYCRLDYGQIWEDPVKGHRIGVLDAVKRDDLTNLMKGNTCPLIIADPPYNVVVGGKNTEHLSKISLDDYLSFSNSWIQNVIKVMAENAHLYIWLGADYNNNFQPLPDVMMLMRQFKELTARNFISLRNQRGYGTQKNWMWTRQEMIQYVKGSPYFTPVYTEIPKVLKGYYKKIKGQLTDNLERSKSDTIRPGNIWIDIQQVFYRMQENVPGCYAQKPLKAIERIIDASTKKGDLVLDVFTHSGTGIIAGERLERIVFALDIDPVFAEISIRRLELYRKTGLTGWQWKSPFPELEDLS